ncbi:unnamed protein product [Cylindrotheca closterium]|uniref:Uncharacterized protein n=1 Tax=Cylindrotheca closterium TaxID=2856 RepID=A0AAD2G7L9_9STRA|nr:unnamed protein product [Cylindrotheca closterium]
MDQYMKNLLANRPNVVIVDDSARMHFDESQRSLYCDLSSAEFEAEPHKTDSRWKCKSQLPSIDDSTKAKDIPIEKPTKRRTLRPSFSGSSKSSKSKQSSRKKSSPTPATMPSKKEQDAKKAQLIIDLVQSLAFRAVTAIHNVKRSERESPSTRACE